MLLYYMLSSVSRQMDLYCPLGISRLVPQDQRSFVWCFVLYNKSFIDQACSVIFFLCVCLWTSTLPQSINTQKNNLAYIQSSQQHAWSMTHIHDSGFLKIKVTINDDDSNNNDTHNNILTSWNLNTSWLLLFLLVHCWITLAASTTSAFVKLSPPWFRITLRSLSWLNAACFNTVWCAGQDRF